MLKRLFFLLSLFCLLALVGKGWHSVKRGFSLQRLFASPASNAKGKGDVLFFYLGKGRQFYAFQNREGTKVLKFARMDFFRPPLWKRLLQGNFEESPRKKRVLQSLALVQERFSEETALEPFFQNEPLGSKAVCLVDALGRRWEVSLDQTVSVLQEKVPLFFPFLEEALLRKDEAEVEEKLSAFLLHLRKRAERCLANKDPHLEENFGWKEGGVVQIDIGSFREVSESEARDGFFATVRQLEAWLEEKGPAWVSWVHEKAAEF